jgi:tripartite ATP-independent transporter DctM subunit
MSPELIGLIGIVVMFILIFMRFWVGAVLLAVGFFGVAFLSGWGKALLIIGTEPYTQIADYTLACLPMFILMGMITAESGIARDLYNFAQVWIGRVRGGLALTTVTATGLFAAVTGSSSATTATMGQIAFPQMERYNYNTGFATGCIVAGGTLGIMIPPSLGFIMYGLLCEQSIGHLFIAGVLPGLLEIICYGALILILCTVNPTLGPSTGRRTTFSEKLSAAKPVWMFILLVVILLGGLYSGVFTPTEAGAIGASAATIISLIGRRLTYKRFAKCLLDTVRVTAMIVLLISGAFVFARLLTLSGLITELSAIMTNLALPRYGILLVLLLFYLIVGTFWDVLTAMVLTLPLVYPVIMDLGFNPIWFGVLMVRCMEIGLITPPFGINLFIIAPVVKVPLGSIYRSVLPFVLTDLGILAILILFPGLSTFLPSRM